LINTYGKTKSHALAEFPPTMRAEIHQGIASFANTNIILFPQGLLNGFDESKPFGHLTFHNTKSSYLPFPFALLQMYLPYILLNLQIPYSSFHPRGDYRHDLYL